MAASRGSGRGRGRGAAQLARRAWPVALEVYRRWDRLSPQEKERYRRMARDYAQRGRTVYGQALERRRRGR